MASSSPSPKLVKSTALAKVQALTARVQALVPTLTSDLSPVTLYQPLNDEITWGTGLAGPGNVFIGGTGGTSAITLQPTVGVWVAPDVLGNGQEYQVQVEVMAPGGGAGGGNATTGGGGGGGGEYASENYTVVPGRSYVWVVGPAVMSGTNVGASAAPGLSGQPAIFDLLGTGLPGGVYAHGGQAGDQAAAGTGGMGGSGSSNSIHYDGGDGGTVASGTGSDYPLAFAGESGLWWNGGGLGVVRAWYMMCDDLPRGSAGTGLSDFSGNGGDGTILRLQGTDSFYFRPNPAPAQVPTLTSMAGEIATNATQAGFNASTPVNTLTQASANVSLPPIGFAGLDACTISAWVQQSPQDGGTWSNTAPGSWGTIAASAAGSAYTGSGNIRGFALGLINRGTASNPSWTVQWKVGNNTVSRVECATGILNPSAWNQVVATFNAGDMALYVNGTEVASGTASITQIPGSGFDVSLFSSPDSPHLGGYFGYMSGLWLATDALNPAGVSEAYGSSPATGGAGGGASGGAGGTGGIGSTPSGAAGGDGGTPGTVPADQAQWTTAGTAGIEGGNGGSTNFGTPGDTGAGGGGGGSLSGSFTGGTTQVSFTSAASYNGTDAQAGAAAGLLYSPNQQGTSSVLFTGAGTADAATGAKNTMMLINPDVYKVLGIFPNPAAPEFFTTYDAVQLSLTVFNANPGNPVPVILEVSYSYDYALPTAYTGSTITASLGTLVIPAGAASATMDLSLTGLMAAMNGDSGYPRLPGAIILGPGDAPTYEAYGQPASPAFACQVYGPGALGPGGESLAPYLTMAYAVNGGLSAGSPGAVGGIWVSYVNTEAIPVGGINSFAVTDLAGNQWASGYTGPVTAFQPGTSPAVPETWHVVGQPGQPAFLSGWANAGGSLASLQFACTADGKVHIIGVITSAAMSATQFMTLPATGYRPAVSQDFAAGFHTSTGYTQGAFLRVTPAGACSVINATTSTGVVLVNVLIPLAPSS